jgi:phosphopantothenoylcysteine synthetase/decarboxylase
MDAHMVLIHPKTPNTFYDVLLLFEDEKSSALLTFIFVTPTFLSQWNNTIFYNQYVKEKLYLLYAQSYIKLQEKKSFFIFFPN